MRNYQSPKMYPKLIPTAVRDNYDEENLSDIDDEVFIRDGKTGILKIDEDCADKRPLMPPRRKGKNSPNMDRYTMPYRVLIAPFCYGILAIVILVSLILLSIFTINVIFPMPLNLMRNWFSQKGLGTKTIINNTSEMVACTYLTHVLVWKRTLPKFAAEAPIRKNDVNDDNVDDIIVGFSVGLDLQDSLPDNVCEIYFDDQNPCLGGVIALNGNTGETLWIHWTAHAIFSVDCNVDITADNIKDCVISGRGAILQAINGQDGNIIWEVEQKYASEVLDVYDAKFVSDLDGDGIGDVVASHIIQNDKSRNSRILLLSGTTGYEIRSVDLPESEQLFVAPQTLTRPDGENIFILATNSKKKSGGLYIVPESTIVQGEMKLRKLHHGPGKGVSLPPILADITSDGTEDIIAAMFSSTIIAYDGITYRQIWNYTIPDSEIISIPIPGYYNDDDIPDFMIKHQIGPGFPIYYYTVTTVLDGKTGKPLLEQPMEDSMSAQMSGLSITVDDYGNDWFLHWSADCLNHEAEKSKYRFIEEDEDVNVETRADLCKLRFNSTLVTKLYALSQHVEPPGQVLYSSKDWREVEFANFGDPREEAERVMQRKAKLQLQQRNDVPYDGEDKVKDQSQFYPNKEENSEYDSEINNKLNLALKVAEDELELGDRWKDSYKVYDNNYDDRQVDLDKSNELRSQRNRFLKKEAFELGNEFSNTQEESMTSNPNDSNDEMIMKKRDLLETSYLDLDFVQNNQTDDNQTENLNIEVDTGNQTELPKLDSESFIERIFKKQSMVNSDVSDKNSRIKRDEELMRGVQRQPPTGILLPPLKKSAKSQAMDLVFSTYWLPPSEIPFVLLQQDIECIQNQKAQLVNEPEQSDEEKIIRDCLTKRGIDYRLYQEAMDKENTNIALGAMTIYRISIQCGCPEDMLAGQSCKNISEMQSWPAHLGKSGNGYFRPWRKVEKNGK